MMSKLISRKKYLTSKLFEYSNENEEISRKIDHMDSKINRISRQTIEIDSETFDSSCETLSKYEDPPKVLEPTEEYNTCLKTFFGHNDSVECLDFEDPMGLLASGSADCTVRIWDLNLNEGVVVLKGHTGWIRDVQISGSTVVSGSNDHFLKLWNIKSLVKNNPESSLVRTFEGHSGGITSLQFDSNCLLSGSIDQTIKQWDMETGVNIQTLAAKDSPYTSVVVAEQDMGIYSSLLEDESFRGWTDRELLQTTTSGSQVASIYFYKVALAGGYSDGSIRLWDMRSGECSRKLQGHIKTVTSVQFDETYVFSSSLDKSFKVFLFINIDLGFTYWPGCGNREYKPTSYKTSCE